MNGGAVGPASGPFTIRHGGEADWDFVRDLGSRTVRDSVSAQRPAPEALAQQAFQHLVDFVAQQSHVALIAESHDAPLGFLLLLDSLPDEVTGLSQAFIAYMAVEPAVRGTGVGRGLLQAAEAEARVRGLPFLALMVTEDNLAARGLYARSGYETERRLLCKAL